MKISHFLTSVGFCLLTIAGIVYINGQGQVQAQTASSQYIVNGWLTATTIVRDEDLNAAFGGVTLTLQTQAFNTNRVRYMLRWTADENGEVEATIPAVFGLLQRVAYGPDSETPPLTNYNMALLDSLGNPLVSVSGIPASSTGHFAPFIADAATTNAALPYSAGSLTLRITNAGSSASGEIHLIVS